MKITFFEIFTPLPSPSPPNNLFYVWNFFQTRLSTHLFFKENHHKVVTHWALSIVRYRDQPVRQSVICLFILICEYIVYHCLFVFHGNYSRTYKALGLGMCRVVGGQHIRQSEHLEKIWKFGQFCGV